LTGQRPRHEARLAGWNEIPATVEPERRTRVVAGQCAQSGAPEV